MRASITFAAIVGATMTVASALPQAAPPQPSQSSAPPQPPQPPQVLCVGTNSNAVCCATDVLGLADLDCAPRKSLNKICALPESCKWGGYTNHLNSGQTKLCWLVLTCPFEQLQSALGTLRLLKTSVPKSVKERDAACFQW